MTDSHNNVEEGNFLRLMDTLSGEETLPFTILYSFSKGINSYKKELTSVRPKSSNARGENSHVRVDRILEGS